MNRLASNFDLTLKREPIAPFINERFIHFNNWLHPVAGGNGLERASGFHSMTVYIKHASGLGFPVTIAGKHSIQLKNDHEAAIHDIFLSADGWDQTVFSLKHLPKNQSVRLAFIRKGRFRLRFGFLEAGQRKEADFDLIVR